MSRSLSFRILSPTAVEGLIFHLQKDEDIQKKVNEKKLINLLDTSTKICMRQGEIQGVNQLITQIFICL